MRGIEAYIPAIIVFLILAVLLIIIVLAHDSNPFEKNRSEIGYPHEYTALGISPFENISDDDWTSNGRVPQRIVNVYANNSGEGMVELRWAYSSERSSGYNDGELVKVEIRRHLDLTGEVQIIDLPCADFSVCNRYGSWLDDNVPEGRVVSYQVRAFNDVGGSSWSATYRYPMAGIGERSYIAGLNKEAEEDYDWDKNIMGGGIVSTSTDESIRYPVCAPGINKHWYLLTSINVETANTSTETDLFDSDYSSETTKEDTGTKIRNRDYVVFDLDNKPCEATYEKVITTD